MRATILFTAVFFFALPLISNSWAQESKKPRLDAVGDPLPAQALHRFGTSRFCTQTEVSSLALSHDGKLLAAADREGRVYLWDADTGKERFITGADSGKRVVLSPDGQWIALGQEAPFEVRNLKKDGPPYLPIGNGARAFIFTPDSKSVVMAFAEEAGIAIYEIESGKEVRRFTGLEGMIGAIAISPDGKLLAAAAPVPMGEEKEEPTKVKIVVWNAISGEKQKEWEHAAKQVKQLTFLPDNKTLIGNFTTRLDAWDATTGVRNKTIKHIVGSAFALDAACKTLATTDGPKVLDFATGAEKHDFDLTFVVRHIAISGDGKHMVASPARFSSASPRLLIWDLTTDKPRTVPEEHRHFVDAVTFSHDGTMIATASHAEGMARVWDARSSKLLHALNIDSLAARKSGGPRNRRTLVDALAFSATARELFVAGQRWDLKSGKPVPLMADDDFLFEQTNSLRAVMAPDGKLAASFLNDHSIQFWDPATAKVIKTIEPAMDSRGSWTSLAFSPNGKLAATGKLIPRKAMDDETPYEETVYVWEIATGRLLKKFRASPGLVTRLMFSPDGETLAIISLPTKLELWHLPTGRLLREMTLVEGDDLPRGFSMPTVAFAPHGQWLAFTYQPGEVLLLETQTAKEILTLRGHRGYVTSVAFSPDNRRLLTGGRDTTALMWSVLPESPALPAAWKDSEKLWLDLGGAPDRAYRIAWALMANPERAVEVLKKRLLPDQGASDKEINELIKNLASPKFAQRDPALKRLKEIGTRALPLLEQAHKNSPNLETTRRIEELLRTVETALTPEALRDLRGLQILEMIGTPEARALLTEITRGDPGAAKTKLAQAALERGKKAN
jgi:WD40 repeat protein